MILAIIWKKGFIRDKDGKNKVKYKENKALLFLDWQSAIPSYFTGTADVPESCVPFSSYSCYIHRTGSRGAEVLLHSGDRPEGVAPVKAALGACATFHQAFLPPSPGLSRVAPQQDRRGKRKGGLRKASGLPTPLFDRKTEREQASSGYVRDFLFHHCCLPAEPTLNAPLSDQA